MLEKQLSKIYNPSDHEDAIYEKWERSGFFNPDNLDLPKNAKPYTIVLPPPNITDRLHMGHTAMLAIEDLLIRYHRMKGERALWIPGTDHAAIATQNVVEKKLLKEEKKSRHDLGREKFLEQVWQFLRETQNTILKQTRKMGASLDWSRQAFTLDEPRAKAVKKLFVDMYNEGVIYRGQRVVNWCPRCQSTLADDEVEYKEEKGKLYWLKYGPFVLATSRPETKLGDTAVAVHPGDKRYEKMVGKKYMIPGVLGEFEITVVADRAVDPKFGSGAIKVTPAHDFTDHEIAQRHGLKMKQVINEQGRMMANAGKYAGLTTKEARQAILADMEKMGLIDHVEDNYLHNIALCYRCGAQIEPLPSKQWFVNVDKKLKRLGNKSLKEKAIKAVAPSAGSAGSQQAGSGQAGQIEFIPERFKKRYLDWMNNLHDWCISRQIWFGHRIPVYYRTRTNADLARTNADGKGVEITYFVHGTTADNEQDKCTGWHDGLLSDLGRKQNLELKETLKKRGDKFDVVFTSDLKRAEESARTVFMGAKITVDKRLRECNYGELNGQPEVKFKNREHYIDNSHPEGESYQDVEKRMREFLNELEKKYAGKKVAILSHQAPQLALEVILNGKTWQQALDQDWRRTKAWRPGWKYYIQENKKAKKPENKIWDMKIYGQDIFAGLVDGTKTIEARAGREKGAGKYWGDIKSGDVVRFSLADEKTDKVLATAQPVEKAVKAVKHFKTIEQMAGVYWPEADQPGKTAKDLKKWWQSRPELYQRIKKYGLWVIEFEPEIYVGLEPPQGEGWKQDEDTLDTWFSSGTWTFSTLGWPDNFVNGKKAGDLAKFHPTSVLETGYEIITLWVSRMIIMSFFALNEIPFEKVYLHGMILDKEGKKMSKSKGNGVDPLDVIARYGADATRMFTIMGNTPGNDTRYFEEKVQGARNLVNKLWNIARFIITNYEPARFESRSESGGLKITNQQNSKLRTQNSKPQLKTQNLSLADKWILGKLENLIERASEDLDNYNFSQATERLKIFTWDDLADWYLEVSKFEKNQGRNDILALILVNLLKLWHPFMPFVTEAIWAEMGNKDFLMVEGWPALPPLQRGARGVKLTKQKFSSQKLTPLIPLYKGDKMQDFELVKDIITAIRQARAENKVEPTRKVKAVIYAGKKKELIEAQAELIKSLRTGIGELQIKETKDKFPLAPLDTRPTERIQSFGREGGIGAIYATAGGVEIYLLGAVDAVKEKVRLEKELANLEKMIKATEGKLANKEFTSKAPQAVVQKEKDKLENWRTELEKLKEQLKNYD